ncbi:MAG TPA: Trk system potassium transporter TrkA [bacterium]|nr:Trk system potassium transporter TrkA [bacterium]HPN44200.1 Trk system potassium transporter TrkA [bacterium]
MKVIIVGAGRVGLYLAKKLTSENHDVIIIENNAETSRRANELVDAMVIEGNGASQEALNRAGIKHCDMIITVTANDEVNIMACMIAAKAGVKTKIARLRNTEYSDPKGWLQKSDMGIDYIIHPEEETARELVLLLRRTSATDVLEFAEGRVQLIGVRIGLNAPIINKNLIQISELFPDVLFRIVAIFRGNTTIIPTGKDIINRGDQLFFITPTASVPKVLEIAGKSEEKLENIMILGGGKVGRLVAAELEKDRSINIKLIESSREKSQIIANAVKRTLIIMGDGTDIDLLAAEGIMDMDGYVAVTNDEETNIISCLLARHMGVTRTLALVNRSDYMPVMSSIGLDAAVDQQMITANAILRYIRRGTIVSFATLRGIDAEIFEILAGPQAKIARKSLKKAKLPQNMLIGMITRGDQVFVPTGDSVIEPGDKLIIFALPSAIKLVESMFI